MEDDNLDPILWMNLDVEVRIHLRNKQKVACLAWYRWRGSNTTLALEMVVPERCDSWDQWISQKWWKGWWWGRGKETSNQTNSFTWTGRDTSFSEPRNLYLAPIFPKTSSILVRYPVYEQGLVLDLGELEKLQSFHLMGYLQEIISPRCTTHLTGGDNTLMSLEQLKHWQSNLFLYLGHLLLPSQTHKQETGSKMEQLGLKPVLRCGIGSIAGIKSSKVTNVPPCWPRKWKFKQMFCEGYARLLAWGKEISCNLFSPLCLPTFYS